MTRPSHTTTVGGVEMMGDLCAPVGSVEWCVGAKNEIERLLADHQFNHQLLEQMLADFRNAEGWRKLKDSGGRAFLFYEDFCKARPPFGLGIASETIDAIISERKDRERQKRTVEAAKENPEPLRKQGRPSGEEKVINSETITISSPERGTAAPYRIRKLRRDAPDVARRLDAGEFKSVAAAERAAKGLDPNPKRKVPTILEILRKAWNKASPADRVAFGSEVLDWLNNHAPAQ